MTRAVETKRKKKDITFPPTHTHFVVVVVVVVVSVHTGGINNSSAVGAYIYLYLRIYIIRVHIYYVLFPAETACRTEKFDVLIHPYDSRRVCASGSDFLSARVTSVVVIVCS